VTGPLLLALTAGMLGAVNPCGFALLPAYLSLLVAGASDTRGAVGRALTAAAGLTLGYVVVFGAFGLALAPLAGWLRPRLPWLTVVLGMGLVVAVAALGVALLRDGLVARLRGAGALVPRLSGLVLLLSGGYVAWYGWYELRLTAGHRDALDDPVIQAAAQVQHALADTVDTLGPALLLAALATLLLVATVTRSRKVRSPARSMC
jgi:cytochrome c biogenesis protein CcdA